MISQKCPKCTSGRVRRGYRKTPFFMKLVGRYYLLCDSCNWEFTGFALPGTVTAKPSRKRIRKHGESVAIGVDESTNLSDEDPADTKEFRKHVRAGS